MKQFLFLPLCFLLILFSSMQQVNAQSKEKNDLIQKSKKAKQAFIVTDAPMKNLFDNAYGYVIFPSIGKGAVGVGGAKGNGILFENGKAVGSAKMVQVSVGLQLGAQRYSEVIFFENKAAIDQFKENKLEFAAQASAVVARTGASADAKYRAGVLVFTEEKKGLMVEAGIGGQKFTYTPF